MKPHHRDWQQRDWRRPIERAIVRADAAAPRLRAYRRSAVLVLLGAMCGQTADGSYASDQSPSISIGGAPLSSLRPAVPAAGLAAGAPGLPDAAATIERVAPGTHGVPSTHPTAPGAAPQAAAPEPPANGWSEAEIRAAQVRCQRALTGLDAQFTFIPQVKSGACGTPAAIELSGFGKGLTISPPIIVSCDLAASLQTWMKAHVQPLAKRHLGTNIVQINTMSSYACRNRYGAKSAPLSQHAFANAIDIRGFVTAKGHLLDVEQHWGPTTKELAAFQASQPAAAPAPIVTAAIPDLRPIAKPARGALSNGWATTLASGPAIMPAAVETASGPAQPATQMASIALKPTFPVFTKASAGDSSAIKIVTTGQPALAGAAPVQPGQPLDGRAHFLREIWQAACGPFTTVLGPEANRAHRNHFHVDLAQRKSSAFCQ